MGTSKKKKKKSKWILTRDLTSLRVGKHPTASYTYNEREKEGDF